MVKIKYVEENILHTIDRPQPEQREIEPFSEDDIRRVLDAMTCSKGYARPGKPTTKHKLKITDRNRAIILLDTGIRAIGTDRAEDQRSTSAPNHAAVSARQRRKGAVICVVGGK